jgi:hypothetical protein
MVTVHSVEDPGPFPAGYTSMIDSVWGTKQCQKDVECQVTAEVYANNIQSVTAYKVGVGFLHSFIRI